MVNRAIEDLVCERFGEDAWRVIREKAGVTTEVFISNESYDDATTYRLVGAAAETLGVGAADVLDLFGRHWITHTAQEGYGPLMHATGATLMEFLKNLPDFHSRVMLIFPNLKPPRFETTPLGASRVAVKYWSQRQGLAPFVTGLLQGLGDLHETAVKVHHVGLRDDAGRDHDEFVVDWTETAA